MIMTKNRFRGLPLILVLLAGLLGSSCTGHIGYGVINWAAPDKSLIAGDVVPVFVQSNIGQVYVIGLPSGKRVELPLWQLTLYKSRTKAKKAAALLQEYRYSYATVKLDGLPMRANPENTAKQVYRLKEGQKIKVLRKGEGTPVLAGNEPLEGSWFEVMADDGSKGWCFSYNLSIVDERDESSLAVEGKDAADPDLESLLSRAWYPDLYRTMVAANKIDLDRMNPAWGFYPGQDTGTARLETPEGVMSFPYTSIVKNTEGAYNFVGSSLNVQVRKPPTIVVTYSDENGMPKSLYYSSLDTTVDELIAAEKARRDGVLEEIRSSGHRFVSGSYGVLQFLNNGKFLWSGYQLLSPAVIPSGAGSGGVVETRVFIADDVSGGYDGTLSFRFDSGKRWITFLYTLSAQGLKLEPVSDTRIIDSIVVSRDITPTVIFFTPEAAQGGQ